MPSNRNRATEAAIESLKHETAKRRQDTVGPPYEQVRQLVWDVPIRVVSCRAGDRAGLVYVTYDVDAETAKRVMLAIAGPTSTSIEGSNWREVRSHETPREDIGSSVDEDAMLDAAEVAAIEYGEKALFDAVAVAAAGQIGSERGETNDEVDAAGHRVGRYAAAVEVAGQVAMLNLWPDGDVVGEYAGAAAAEAVIERRNLEASIRGKKEHEQAFARAMADRQNGGRETGSAAGPGDNQLAGDRLPFSCVLAVGTTGAPGRCVYDVPRKAGPTGDLGAASGPT